ncbi:Hsp20/alpha crystallin family protein [Natrialbaceae archaeon A-gly3]
MSALRDALRDLPEAVFFDLLESDEAYLLVLDVPGVSAETLEVTVEDGRIVVDAEREKSLPQEFDYIEENRPALVEVDLPLPNRATESGAEASVSRGVLELWLPKREAGETKIDVVEDEGV